MVGSDVILNTTVIVSARDSHAIWCPRLDRLHMATPSRHNTSYVDGRPRFSTDQCVPPLPLQLPIVT